MSLITRYPAVKQLCDEAQLAVDSLVAGPDGGGDQQSIVSQKVNALSAEIAALRKSLALDPLGRQDVWRERVANLEAEAQALRRAIERHLSFAYRQASEEREREQLLEGHTATSAVILDLYGAESASLRRSHAAVDESIEQTSATLQELIDQRKKLSHAQTTVASVASSLGLSDSLIRVIERRTRTDVYITLGGITLVTLLIYAVWNLRSSY